MLSLSIIASEINPKTCSSPLLINIDVSTFRILLSNSGINPDEWLPQVKKAKDGMGINVNDPTKLVDLKANGVIDPARVTKEALQNSVSIAGTAMTMGALIVDIPQKSDATPQMPSGMGGMDY